MKKRQRLELLYDQIVVLHSLLARLGEEGLELLKPSDGELIEAEMEFSDYTFEDKVEELGPDWKFLSIMDQRQANKEAREEERKMEAKRK